MASQPEPVRSAKALRLGPDTEAELTELRARFEVQRSELHQAARALASARARMSHDQRQITQLKARVVAAEGRVAELEEEAASAYARSQEREARSAAQRELVGAEAEERFRAEREEAAREIANLRDALAGALERERVFRRVEADLRRRLLTMEEAAVDAPRVP